MQTKDVFLEAAYFDPIVTRKTARSLGLISEASQRFEKGVNPEWIPVALNRAAPVSYTHLDVYKRQE